MVVESAQYIAMAYGAGAITLGSYHLWLWWECRRLSELTEAMTKESNNGK